MEVTGDLRKATSFGVKGTKASWRSKWKVMMSKQLIIVHILRVKKPRLRMVNYLIQGQSRWGQILVPVNDISLVQSDLGTVSKKGIAARKNTKMFATNVLFEVSDIQLKTLSDKSREAKVKSKPRTVPCSPKYSAGLELLSRYEDTWAALHRRAKECASAGELVDSEVVMLSAHWEKKRTSLVELQEQLQQLPGLLADLESMTANLTHLEASFEEVESHLLNLEDLCGQCELERYKHMQSQQLENYKKNKRKELETFKGNFVFNSSL
ncbi:dysbindin-like [Leptonychotes weddellii]|uniref:Dysbindin-like n=1 Tax=Leptonychotes weddellii TaxID=9713 RepID=A0A2U3YMM2_LEPWE|nr:dysbindin-like [Leptonychotes weddellii]